MFLVVIFIFIGPFYLIYSPVVELDFVPKYDGNACLQKRKFLANDLEQSLVQWSVDIIVYDM